MTLSEVNNDNPDVRISPEPEGTAIASPDTGTIVQPAGQNAVEDTQPDPESDEVDQTNKVPFTVPFNRDEVKELGAKTIARGLIVVFGGFLAVVLLITLFIVQVSATPNDAKLYAESVIATLDALSNFASAVFAPLLAFVLGYYFSEKRGSDSTG